MKKGKFVKKQGFECPNCGYLNREFEEHYAECDNCKQAYEKPEYNKSKLDDGLCLRVRKVGELMRPDDMVLFDEMFVPIGFSTEFNHYFAGQNVTKNMQGKVIYKQT